MFTFTQQDPITGEQHETIYPYTHELYALIYF